MDTREQAAKTPETLAYTPASHLLGYLSALRDDPIAVLKMALGLQKRMVRLRVAHISAFFLFHPEDIRRVLLKESEHYKKQARGYDKVRLLLGNGLLTSEGDFWRRQRRIAQPAFHRKCIEGFADAMVKAAKDQCERWRVFAKEGKAFDMSEEMGLVTLRIAGETLMSADMRGEGRQVGEAMAQVMSNFNALVNSPLPWPEYWPSVANLKMWRARRVLLDITDGVIEARRQSGAHVPDLLGMLMAAEDPESGETMDDTQLRDEVLTMLLAGHETTANTLTWTLYLLSTHPEIAQTLEAEVERVLKGRDAQAADVHNLSYTHQVIKEGLRLYPPGWIIGRRVATERELGGYRIPKGSYVFLSPYAMHRHPEHWQDPETFDPSRFGPEGEDIDRFVYFPFLRGQRQCIGDRFAEMEMVLLLATFVQRYRFELVKDHPIALDPSVTLRPKHGIQMTLRAR